MPSTTEYSHSQFIDDQFSILEALAQGESPEQISSFARQLIPGIYGHEESGLPIGAELGISVNDVCNLSCGHCYYASTHDRRLIQRDGNLNEDEWVRIVDDGISAGFRHFSIIGKEPLLSSEITFRIFSQLQKHKGSFPDIRYELITNGTLIEENIDRLARFPELDFCSISFDGYGEDHDKVRGQGTYEKSRRGLRLASERGITNLTVINTAMPHNIHSLDAMIHDLSDNGARYVTVGFCFPTVHNQRNLVAGLGIFDEAIEKVRNVPKGLDITLSLMGDDHAHMIAQLFERGFMKRENLAVTEDMAPTLIIPLNDDPRTAVQIVILPTMFYGGFRVDCTGAALDYCEDLRFSEARQGFGNVRTESLKKLYDQSRKIWPAYVEKYYQRLSDAFKKKDLAVEKNWYKHQ